MAKKKPKSKAENAPRRIVSLLAAGTELVCAIGLGDRLVGVSHECDTPEFVRQLPRVSSSLIDPNLSSDRIHEEVSAAIRAAEEDPGKALSVYNVNTQLLNKLRPDVIITQSQCAVCAVSLEDVTAAVCELVNGEPDIVSLEPNKLEDIWADIERVATALGVATEGAKLVGELRGRIDAIAMRSDEAEKRPTVEVIEWLDPLMAAGNWVPQLVEAAGGDNALSKPGKPSPTITFAKLKKANPDVIVIAPCGFDIDRTRRDLNALTKQKGWDTLKAVTEGRVYLADGNRYFNRSGPRVVETTEILAEVLHPRAYDFGHEGKAWVRLETEAAE
ncbi:MAG: ABC transporter substrate-binding protein [Phycisphaera sp.]|nr:ABC transporter substrate-binding protein [Phycisphaera sp.]